MRLYWTLNSIPEYTQVPEPERKRLWRDSYRRIWGHWQTWLALIVCGACAGIGSHFGHILGAMAGGGIGGFVLGQVTTHLTLGYFRQAVIDAERERNV